MELNPDGSFTYRPNLDYTGDDTFTYHAYDGALDSNNTATVTITVEEILGVEDNALSNAIVMYPNPARNQVILVNSSHILLENAMIYDIHGKLITQIDLHDMQDEKKIDVSAYAPGVYMVQITGERSSVVKRFIKE